MCSLHKFDYRLRNQKEKVKDLSIVQVLLFLKFIYSSTLPNPMVSYIVADAIWRYDDKYTPSTLLYLYRHWNRNNNKNCNWMNMYHVQLFMHSIGACFNVNIVMAIASSLNNICISTYYYYYCFNVLTHFLFVFVYMRHGTNGKIALIDFAVVAILCTVANITSFITMTTWEYVWALMWTQT